MSIDGKETPAANELRNTAAELPPGKEVPVSILRNGKEMKLSIRVEERSEKNVASLSQTPPPPPEQPPAESGKKEAGLTVGEITKELRRQYDIPDEVKGVVVLAVDPALTDNRTALQEGDIIREVRAGKNPPREISSVADFHSALSKAGKGQSVMLLVRRGDSDFYLAFKL